MRPPNKDIDKALAYMMDNHPGPHSFYKMGEYCGCTRENITNIYNKAMAKLVDGLRDAIDEMEDLDGR